MKLILYITILLSFFSCKKEFETINTTEITSVIERDFFNDSIYKIKQFNLTSTNDSILNFARVKIWDDSTSNIIWDGAWRTLRQSNFSLPLRKKYKLNFELYRKVNDIEIIDYSEFEYINNNRIPTKFQLISAEVDPSIIAAEDYYGLSALGSDSYGVILIADLSTESSGDEFDKNTETNSIKYYQKIHSPRKISFNFNNLFFDTKKMENNSPAWMHYSLSFNYPLDFEDSGNFTEDFRDITFLISSLQKFDNNEVNPNTEYKIENDPGYTSSGADYFGELTIKWIYED